MELVQTLNARVNLAFASSVMELGHSAASSASSMVGAYLSSLVCLFSLLSSALLFSSLFNFPLRSAQLCSETDAPLLSIMLILITY
jgi:hypothetical protein